MVVDEENKLNLADIVICLIVSFMLMAIYLFELESWGRYVIFGCALLVALIYSFHRNYVFPIIFESFHSYVLAFAIFCFLSSVWAWNSSLALSKGITILVALVTLSLIYPYYRENNIDLLLKSFMLSGYGISAYTIFYYGLSSIVSMLSGGVRMGNDFSNANSIGLVATVSCIIQMYFWLKKERNVLIVFLIPTIICIAISQSRKAIVMLLVGIAATIITSGDKTKRSKRFLKIIVGITVLFLMLYLVQHLEIFSGVSNRFTILFESINGERAEDIRSIYRRIGMQQFFKTPVFGIGMGNSLELLASVGQRRTYLHCNFVELLASGGVIGFVIYYLIYVYLLTNLWKYRKIDSSRTMLCFVLLVLMLVMDYGMVSYYDKQQYMYFMCFFIHVEHLKKKSFGKIEKNLNKFENRGRKSIGKEV